ncbi:Calcineurin-like phosphoesterase-like protein 2 [Elsinoe fawcettii]|nr:Calcineurin-like phosphoesterase-like protein 2 [Elsinoe fawcettii]
MANNITKTPTLRKTRIVCVSDTHGASPKDGAFKLPKGDILIHAGDLTNQGGYAEMKKTAEWITEADFEAKIVVAGNHDLPLDPAFTSSPAHQPSPSQPSEPLTTLLSHPSITHLSHHPFTLRLTSPTGPHTRALIFASPFSPTVGRYAFSYPPCPSGLAFSPSRTAEKLWAAIPLDTDILVAHTPMRGHLDLSPKWGRAGCEALRRRVGMVRPGLVVGGHVHEGRGVEVVRWSMEGMGGRRGLGTGMAREEEVTGWVDPAVGKGRGRESRVDLAGRVGQEKGGLWERGRGLENDFSRTRGVKPVVVAAGEGRLRRSSVGAMEKGWVEKVNRVGQRRGEVENHVSFSVDEGEEETRKSRLHHGVMEAWTGREGRRETCVVNAAIMARSHGMGAKRYNQPIVVEIDLPVWEEVEDDGDQTDEDDHMDLRPGSAGFERNMAGLAIDNG